MVAGGGQAVRGGAKPPAAMSPHVGSKEEEQRLWGRLPNVYRHALTMQQLREDPRVPFEGLPPVEQLVLAGPATHRCAAHRRQLPFCCRCVGAVPCTALAAAVWAGQCTCYLAVQVCQAGRQPLGPAARGSAHHRWVAQGGLAGACRCPHVSCRQYTQPLQADTAPALQQLLSISCMFMGLSIAPVHAGLVRGALGLYEASAVKKLGIPSSRQGGRVTSEYPAVNTPH